MEFSISIRMEPEIIVQAIVERDSSILRVIEFIRYTKHDSKLVNTTILSLMVRSSRVLSQQHNSLQSKIKNINFIK